MVSEILRAKKYSTLTVYVYDGDETDYTFYGIFDSSNVMFDGEELTLFVTDGVSHMEIVLPVLPDGQIRWYEESECYEYYSDGKRYELYF